MFSGGLDVIPVLLGFYLIYYVRKVFKHSTGGYKVIHHLSILMAVCMVVAQTGWLYAITQNVYLLGTAFDNIWLIVNTCAVLIPIVLAYIHDDGTSNE